jgi:hypothetical protein
VGEAGPFRGASGEGSAGGNGEKAEKQLSKVKESRKQTHVALKKAQASNLLLPKANCTQKTKISQQQIMIESLRN